MGVFYYYYEDHSLPHNSELYNKTIVFEIIVRNDICCNLLVYHCLSHDACIVAGLESIPQGQGSKLE